MYASSLRRFRLQSKTGSDWGAEQSRRSPCPAASTGRGNQKLPSPLEPCRSPFANALVDLAKYCYETNGHPSALLEVSTLPRRHKTIDAGLCAPSTPYNPPTIDCHVLTSNCWERSWRPYIRSPCYPHILSVNGIQSVLHAKAEEEMLLTGSLTDPGSYMLAPEP